MSDTAPALSSLPGPPALPGPPGTPPAAVGQSRGAAHPGAPGLSGPHADVDASAREAVMYEQENAAREVFAAGNKRPLDSGPAQNDAKVCATRCKIVDSRSVSL